MNSVFDINRFLKYEKRELQTNKGFFLFLPIFATILLALQAICSYAPFLNSLSPSVVTTSYALLAIAPAFYPNKIDYTIPASIFEKFSTLIFNIIFVLPIIAFTSIFLVSNILVLLPIPNIEDSIQYYRLSEIISPTKIFFLFSFQSIFLVGYCYFKRYVFIKTSLIIILFYVLIIIGILVSTLYSFYNFVDLNSSTNISPSFRTAIDTMNESGSFETISYILAIISTIGLLITCFFKIRETEI